MSAPGEPSSTPIPLTQPKAWVHWAAVALALAGWYVSFQSFRVSAGARELDPIMEALCGQPHGPEGTNNCTAVLTSPQAYFPLGREPGTPRLPVSTLGLGYFAFVATWYLFVGSPTHPRRTWHLLIAAIVLAGIGYSAYYMYLMAAVLHRWCASCLTAHGINAGLVLLTLLAWPWHRPALPQPPHPSARLALATATAGGLLFLLHLAVVFVIVAGSILKERTAAYAAVLDDPEFIVWDFQRQPPVSIRLYEDEAFDGPVDAPNTIVLFSDFQCSHCRQAHDVLRRVCETHPGRVRIAYRYYPQDPACNPNERFRGGGHPCACQAARAAEAARQLGGPESYTRMQDLLYARQPELPTKPFEQQTDQQRHLLTSWAAEIGLDPAAFAALTDSPAVTQRIAADIAQAHELGLSAMPVVYLNGKRVRNWSKLEVWERLLADGGHPTTRPAASAHAP